MTFTSADVKDYQRTLNVFTTTYLKGVNPLIIDGDVAFLTNRRTRTVEFYLGYDQDRIKELGDAYVRSIDVRRELVRRARHPRDAQYFPSAYVRDRGIERRRAQFLRWQRNQVEAWLVPGVTYYGGKPVAKCAIPYLTYAKNHGWVGGVNSGWRDPWYSRQLCITMCGAPTCSGRCAGLSSNHVGNYCGRFAIDVSDYVRFGQIMARMPLDLAPNRHRILNLLGARDPVHFSPSGN